MLTIYAIVVWLFAVFGFFSTSPNLDNLVRVLIAPAGLLLWAVFLALVARLWGEGKSKQISELAFLASGLIAAVTLLSFQHEAILGIFVLSVAITFLTTRFS